MLYNLMLQRKGINYRTWCFVKDNHSVLKLSTGFVRAAFMDW